jgi:cation transport ATPase
MEPTPTDVLAAAAAVEQSSEHPLARAIVDGAAQRGLEVSEPERFSAIPGLGIEADLGGRVMLVGDPCALRHAVTARTRPRASLY